MYYMQMQVFDMYRANTLVELVDPVLNENFLEEEAVRFLKVGLLCVQDISRKRPQMSEALKMLTDEIAITNQEISQPRVADPMDVKIGGHRHSTVSFFSRGSTSVSTMSPNSSFH